MKTQEEKKRRTLTTKESRGGLERKGSIPGAMTIADKVRRMKEVGEPLATGTGQLYNETWTEGVDPATDIRSNGWEIRQHLLADAAAARSQALRDYARNAGIANGGIDRKEEREADATQR